MSRTHAFLLLLSLGWALPLRAQLRIRYAPPDIGLRDRPHVGGINRFGYWLDEYPGWSAKEDDDSSTAIIPLGIPKAVDPTEWPTYLFPWNVSPDSVVLVQRCRNQLWLPLTDGIQPVRFTVEGATLEVDRRNRWVYIVPTAAKATLQAYRGRQLLFTHEFRVVSPPAPETIVIDNFSERSRRRPPLLTKRDYQISLRVIPDQLFDYAMAADAQYLLPEFQVTLLRNGRAVELPIIIHGQDGNLEQLKTKFRSMDQLQIDVRRVLRTDFQGQVESVPYQRRYLRRVRAAY